jgi:hypothetical protein
MTTKDKTIREFLAIISKTDIFGAKEWIQGFAKSFPNGVWEEFLRRPATPEAIESIISGIFQRAKAQIDSLSEKPELYCRLCKSMERLTEEIRTKIEDHRIL